MPTLEQIELASIHDTSDATPRDWMDNLHVKGGWTSLTCSMCGLLYRGWNLKTHCASCAVPKWPEGIRHIRASAIVYDGKVWTLPAPARHHDIKRHIVLTTGKGLSGPDRQGFVDDNGIYVGRVEAAVIAIAAGQLIVRIEDIKAAGLFSEDVW